MGSSVVVADEGALDGRADPPVEPDGDVEGEQALYHAGPQAGGDAAAVSFQAELVLEVGDTLQDRSVVPRGPPSAARPAPG
jgi:hypothetical protein